MTEQNRQGARTKPSISRHPLFPAIIALWFGALFGLGSLAVRPSLLEELVIAAQIDALVPAAAPPLGITSRILLALAMALIGGMIGGTIARRIGRPKPVARPRRRGAIAPGTEQRGYASGRYIQHDDEADDLDDEIAPSSVHKRRSLAISEEEQPLELQEFAPLPGGTPQILNLADVSAEPIRAKAHADHFAPRLAEEPAYTPPAHDTPRAQDAIARLERTFSPQAAGEVDLFDDDDEIDGFDNFSSAANVPPRAAFATPGASFAPPAASGAFARPGPAAASDAPPAAARFQAPGPVADASAPREPIALNPHQPLFANRGATMASDFSRPASDAVPAETPRVAEAPPVPDTVELPRKTVFAPPIGAAAQKLSGAELETLSPVELVERLALSIQRRREVASEAATAAPSVANTVQVPEAASVQAAPPRFAIPAAPAAVVPSAVVPPPMAMPAALRPVSTHDDFDDDMPDLVLPPRFVVPASAVSAAENAPAIGDDQPEPVAEVAQPEAAKTETSTDEIGPVGDDDARALEEGYSSLLDLSRPAAPRQQFVRIEEPVEHGAAIEPVVVFPGQVARMAGSRFAQPASAPAPVAEPVRPDDAVRRFDSPALGAAAPRVTNPNTLRADPEEAERALRSALATLQRMSAAS